MASDIGWSKIRQMEVGNRKMEPKQQIDRRGQIHGFVRKFEEKLHNKGFRD